MCYASVSVHDMGSCDSGNQSTCTNLAHMPIRRHSQEHRDVAISKRYEVTWDRFPSFRPCGSCTSHVSQPHLIVI